MVTDLKQVMRDVPLFAGLLPTELDRIAQVMRPIQAGAGEVVCLEGQPGYLFFVIASGEVAIEHGGQTVAKLHTGDHFGELALLDHGPRTATVRTVTDTQMYVLGEPSLDALLNEVPALGQKLLAALATRLREADGQAGPPD
jgi:CRP-like cAMP-binding protein